MITFKEYINEGFGSALAAAAIAGSAMAAPPKPEALQQAAEHIKNYEGFLPSAKVDKITTGNPLMIGYGTTKQYPNGKPIQATDTVTKEQATEHLKQHIEKHVSPHLEKIPGWDEMDAGKQASLIGFGYNAGGAFYGAKGFETITKALKDKNWDAVPEAMKLYNKSKGEVRTGLVRRRETEAGMWKGPSEQTPKVQTAKPTIVTPQPTPTQQVPTKAPVAAPTQAPAPTNVHQVVSGDTLGAIAKKNNTTVQDIQKLNPDIKDPNAIKPGQKIKTK